MSTPAAAVTVAQNNAAKAVKALNVVATTATAAAKAANYPVFYGRRGRARSPPRWGRSTTRRRSWSRSRSPGRGYRRVGVFTGKTRQEIIDMVARKCGVAKTRKWGTGALKSNSSLKSTYYSC